MLLLGWDGLLQLYLCFCQLLLGLQQRLLHIQHQRFSCVNRIQSIVMSWLRLLNGSVAGGSRCWFLLRTALMTIRRSDDSGLNEWPHLPRCVYRAHFHFIAESISTDMVAEAVP